MSDARSFDVVVVGCGIAGLSAAATALQSGARVAILERSTKDERGGKRVEAALLRVAFRPENITIDAQNGGDAVRARVTDRRYHGTQTVYDIDLFGHRLEVIELGTAARHEVGADTTVSLPRSALWAYRDQGSVLDK